MSSSRPLRYATAALLSLSGVSGAQLAVLHPMRTLSPSGEYELAVEPSHPSGGGPASYRFTRRGAELWSGSRPWTLWEAQVTDDGLVAGYAYGAGLEGGAGDSLTLVLLDARGEARLEERSDRQAIRWVLGGPEPTLNGLFVDPENAGLIFRVRRGFQEAIGPSESWWSYDLATGKPVARTRPCRDLRLACGLGPILGARAVPGTGLVLVHWAPRDESGVPGSTFTLLDGGREVRWRLDWPGDLARAAETPLGLEVLQHGAILDAGAPGLFTLFQAGRCERVTFEVRELVDPAQGGRETLEVREIARSLY